MKVLITGANGHLGIRLVSKLYPQHQVVAVVRSENARQMLAGVGCETHVIDYSDSDALKQLLAGCECAIHLVGIIKASKANSYEHAHERPCEALVAAAEASCLKHIVSLSIIGSDAASPNACLASRGRAENILLASSVPVTLIRVPMVLGEGDFASRALGKKAASSFVMSFRTTSLEQPIYAGDVVDAIEAAVNKKMGAGILEIAGPESISRQALIKRAARVSGNDPAIISIPLFIGLMLGWLLERLLASPPVTADMIELLDHDDRVDVSSAVNQLDIQLTSLDDMLAKVLQN